MKKKKNLLIAAAAVVCCAVVIWFSTAIQGSEKVYEIQPYITLPEYRTDTARAIDAYEYLMDRFMDLTERNLARIDTNLRNIAEKLGSLDARLTELSARMARIEKALQGEQPEHPADKGSEPEPAQQNPQ